jgi:VanZ family protein
MSAEHTDRVVEAVVRAVVPNASARTVEAVNHLLRKTSHVSEYFLFVLLLDRGFWHVWRSAPRSVAASVVAAVLYSLTDEGHQGWVPSRTASLLDCGWDTLGAALAATIVAARGNPARLDGRPER